MFHFLLLLLVTSTLAQSPRTPYEAALHSIVTNLQANLTQMQLQLTHALSVSNTFNTQPALQAEILAQGLANFHTILRPTLGQTAIPYNMITWNCNGTSFNNYNTIANNNQQVLVDQQNLNSVLSGLSTCPQVTALNNEYQLLQYEVSILQAEFGYLCPVNNAALPPPAPVLPNQRMVNNLNNPLNNWIFGLTNPQSYYYNINNLILQGAQQCPPATPYVSTNNTCIACPLIYDVSLQNCSACPAGSVFNYSIHQCAYNSGVTVLKNSYPGQNNYIGVQPQFDPKLTSCPASAPFFDGQACVACAPPSYFDYSNSLCLNCHSGLVFSTATQKCASNNSLLPPPPVFNSNIGPSSLNYVGIPSAPNPAYSNCPLSHPFFDGLHCLSCTLPLFFNFTVNTCQQCPLSMQFNTTTGNCQLNPAMIYYTSSVNGLNNYVGAPPNIPANNNKVVMGCPAATPYSNGVVCMTCALPSFYNFNTNVCELCQPGLVFDVTTKTCIPQTSASFMYNSNIAQSTNFMGQVPPYNSALLTCSLTTPYFDGSTCVACSLPNYFDFATLTCQPCPPSTAFDPTNRLCTYSSPSYVTNLNNPNIFYNGNYSALQTTLSQSQLTYASVTCPGSTPFYDATTNTCIACPSSTPVFNIKYNSCMNCGPQGFFDPTIHLCISTQRVPVSLTRELMNTFNL